MIERFAPAANGVRAPPARERVELLITTDVLAEGLDLHDSADVVSYDLPWNPVRLIQRVGRIDRLGSAHERIRSYHFIPDRELERTLGVMRRLRRKLHAIDCSVGSETGVLAAHGDLPRALRGDAAALARMERDAALACDIEERLRAAHRRFTAASEAGLPLFDPVRTERDASGPGDAPSARRPDTRGSPRVLVARIRARLPLPAAVARRRGPLCGVFLERAGSPHAVLVRGAAAVEDDRLSGAALLAALEVPNDASLRPRDRAIAARAARRAAAHFAAGSPAPPAASVTAALRRRLLLLLERAPGGASAAECALAEELLHALATCPAGSEWELRRRLPELRRLPLAPLCEALARTLAGPRSSTPAAARAAAPAAPKTGPVRVLAVLLLEPDPVDPPRPGS